MRTIFKQTSNFVLQRNSDFQKKLKHEGGTDGHTEGIDVNTRPEFTKKIQNQDVRHRETEIADEEDADAC